MGKVLLACRTRAAWAVCLLACVLVWPTLASAQEAPGGAQRGERPAVAPAAGGARICALRADGDAIDCGRVQRHHVELVNVALDALGSIGAGELHSCQLGANGIPTCWGYNDAGRATPPAGLLAALSTGSDHNCGLRDDGEAICWGQNRYGQSTAPAGPFHQIDAGDSFTCALRDRRTGLLGLEQQRPGHAAAGSGRPDLSQHRCRLRAQLRGVRRQQRLVLGLQRRWRDQCTGRQLAGDPRRRAT